MCCQPTGNQRGFKSLGHAFGCGCGCESFFRRFVSAKEEQERLEKYKDQLKKELAAVEEYLEGLKSEQAEKRWEAERAFEFPPSHMKIGENSGQKIETDYYFYCFIVHFLGLSRFVITI